MDYLIHNELGQFDGSLRTRERRDKQRQKLINRLELLQVHYEDNRLLY